MLRLRCKTKNGSHLMQGLSQHSCVQELKSKVEELTGIPCDVQKILVGYPPSSLDLRNGHAHLKDYPIKSGDTLIVEEEKNKMKTQASSPPPQASSPSPQASSPAPKASSPPPKAGSPAPKASSPPPKASSPAPKVPRLEPCPEPRPVLARRVVPADNSCLFTSVSYAVEGGVYDPSCSAELRRLIGRTVAGDPAAYSEAVLGKTNEEYCAWIGRDDTWGGAIEVSILSRFYQCEICVVDTQTLRVDRFGEDAGYRKRVLLIYDGIHYDPLQKETPGSDAPPQTVFAATDDVILAQALELADEARRRRQFTDVNGFALRCLVCQTGLVGQKEARDHAKETGHTNFGEV
ncbi:ubiquitin thioesterase OTU1 [Gadus morhua]|uniref:Ubiquitin thioesterase OTU n=1 Tax=Gadus morhua TaxID=8049 RepID=A0A8C5C681_GADMO|nr:ubiquitin thioesterase OTU1 [Gadus morhua]XP_030231002.1 ubiquitin thioesterase OTU1 [Gadus morhua]